MIAVPTAEDLARANAEFDRDWGGVDDVLRELCRRHPGHTDRRSVTAKVALTLRLDGLDNFRFTLMHELAHLVLGHEGSFIDETGDMAPTAKPLERQTDRWASDRLPSSPAPGTARSAES